MLRFYFRLTLILLALFTIAQLLIHAQLYDDHELRELLLPEGCPAPCFMGIRPGETTVGEALSLLETSGWVDQITDNGMVISWTWNGRQPRFIDAQELPQIRHVKIIDGRDVINELAIPTTVATGSFLLLLNNPVSLMTTDGLGTVDAAKISFVWLRYADVLIKGRVPCPSWMRDVVRMRATVTFYDYRNANFDFEEQFWDRARFESFSTHRLVCT
jgi:hypothetical protein